MKKRLLVRTLCVISAGLCLLSIILFNAAHGMAGGAEDQIATEALLTARSEKMMIIGVLFGVLAAVARLFKKHDMGGLR